MVKRYKCTNSEISKNFKGINAKKSMLRYIIVNLVISNEKEKSTKMAKKKHHIACSYDNDRNYHKHVTRNHYVR